jgi:hypothetical protein
MAMLNEQLVRKLIDALESGRYRQRIGSLRCEDTFCVLGVACDLVKEQVHGEWQGVDSEYFILAHEVHGHDDYPPDRVIRLYGFDTGESIARLDGRTIGGSLSSLNDDGSTFSELAGILKELIAEQGQVTQ